MRGALHSLTEMCLTSLREGEVVKGSAQPQESSNALLEFVIQRETEEETPKRENPSENDIVGVIARIGLSLKAIKTS